MIVLQSKWGGQCKNIPAQDEYNTIKSDDDCVWEDDKEHNERLLPKDEQQDELVLSEKPQVLLYRESSEQREVVVAASPPPPPTPQASEACVLACKLQSIYEPINMIGDHMLVDELIGWHVGTLKQNPIGSIVEIFLHNNGQVPWPQDAHLFCVAGSGFGVDRLELNGGVQPGIVT